MRKIVHLVGLFHVYIYIYIYSSEKVKFTRMDSVMGRASVSSEVVKIAVFKYDLDKC